MLSYLITFISFLVKPDKRKLINFSYKLRSKTGLEIGGPSSIFNLKGYFPVYPFAKRIDSVNYSTETVWEGSIKEGLNFNYFKSKQGFQFIQEAADLKGIPPSSYDFILSSHSLEHIANPIKALKNWQTLLKPGGQFILILPDKQNTFDLNRPYTSFNHLLDDYQNNIDEHDTTHFGEIVQHHLIDKDQPGMTQEVVKERLNDNYARRLAHHHVFSFEVIKELLKYCGFETTYQQFAAPFHLVTMAVKK